MPYIQFNRSRSALPGMLLALALLSPGLAQAQIKVNQFYGKKLPAVEKLLGKPVELAGTPPNYSRFHVPWAANAEVWYFWDKQVVSKVRFDVLAKPGDTFESIEKKFGVSLGANPKVYGLKLPSKTMANSGPVPNQPWANITIAYLYVLPAEKDVMAYCKAHNLNPYKTYFWTVQVISGQPRGNAMGTEGVPTGGRGKGGRGGRKGRGK